MNQVQYKLLLRYLNLNRAWPDQICSSFGPSSSNWKSALHH